MPKLFLPPAVRELAGGQQAITVEGATVREVLNAIEARYPGVTARLVDGDTIRAGLAVVINNQPQQRGLDTRVTVDTEIHFLPPIAGG